MTDQPQLRRDVLPIPDRTPIGLTTYDAKDPATSFPPIEPLRPPEGAPNVLIVLLDDVGFAASSAFGGPVSTPIAERLAADGLKYNRFHTTALCSPTRQALLTGRNHHAVGMGGITEIATSAPGYNSIRPNTCAPLAETLKLNGYSTAQFGKCHEVPVWETSPMGPFSAWPTGSGFEHFYGFIGGETNQYAPAIYRDTVPIEQPKTAEEGYHFTEDMTDQAIDWIKQQKALMADKPFFVYFAPGATHAPHHVPTEWSDKYKGKFDDGWDALRERTLARQKELGVVPAEAELTERPEEIPAWDDMPDDLKPVLARQMEVYAGFLEHTDHHVGRLIDSLRELGILESTLVYYVIGDNGASAEGTPTGCFNELVVLNGAFGLETTEFMVSKIDEFGTPTAYNHFAVGWAHAMDTPYQWTKQIASHWGGTRNGTIVHWPSGIKAKGEIRSQFHHVIDVAATVLDVAQLPEPLSVNGVQQAPLHGVSMAYSFDDAGAEERRTTQYFEMFCNRGIYHEGWTAVTRHSIPWVADRVARLRRRRLGALCAGRLDAGPRSRGRTARPAAGPAAPVPDRGREVQRAAARRPERSSASTRISPAGRSSSAARRSSSSAGWDGCPRTRSSSMKNKSHSITAQIDVPDAGADGVILSQGGAFGGFALYAKDGKPAYCYNLFGLQQFKVYGEDSVPAGEHQVRMEFTYDGGGLGKGGDVKLYVDGEQVGEGSVDGTVPMLFSADETTDVGSDTATPVSDDYGPTDNEFTGNVQWVQLDIDAAAEDTDHLIGPEERLRVAMARQ